MDKPIEFTHVKMNDPVNRSIHKRFATRKVMHDDKLYSLQVQEFVDFGMWATGLPKLDGKDPFIFRARAWWAEGQCWWIGDRYADRETNLHGPFNDLDEVFVYISLIADAPQS